RMDGLTFLTKLMHYHPMPVIVISSAAQATCSVALEAIRRGAVDVLAKPSDPYSLGEVSQLVADKIRAAFVARLPPPFASKPRAAEPRVEGAAFPPASVVAIGASTGGTQAVEELLLQMPAQCPPLLIAQHIPPVFSAAFAGRLNSVCPMDVK